MIVTTPFRLMLVLWILATLATPALAAGGGTPPETSAGAHGAADAQDKTSSGESAHGDAKNEESAEPAYQLGDPLEGHFDLNTLRSLDRVAPYRYSLQAITTTLRYTASTSRHVRISLSVEFGSESGMAELYQNEAVFTDLVLSILLRFRVQELLRLEGKLKLKELIVEAFNQRLETVQIRQVYLTEFKVTQE